MIFMSQSALTDTTSEPQWDAWSVDHLRLMVTVQGIGSATRFKTNNPQWPRSLAMYSITSPEVFSDPYYQSIRGMGPWLPRIDKRFYRRNLFEGADRAPAVDSGAVLLVTDQDQPDLRLADCAFTWLRTVGLDQSTAYRGISVVPAPQAAAFAHRPDVAVYAPC